jgi:molybdate/tungstate transport system permease protein
MQTRDRAFKSILFGISIIAILFILLPIIRLLTYSTPSLIFTAMKDKSTINAIINSIVFSLITAASAVVFGIPLAYLMAKKSFGKLEGVFEGVSDIPLAVPHTVAGIALLLIYGRDGTIGSLFYKTLGIKLTGTAVVIIIAMLFVSFPFFIDAAREGFKSVDIAFENASRNLGASAFSTFFRINLPLATQSILTGFLSTWARAISEFGAVVILAYYPMTAPVKIYDAFTQYNLSVSIAIAATLLLFSLIIFIALKILTRERNENFNR